MKYLAKVTLSPWAKVERTFSTYREAHVWAFQQEGTSDSIIPVKETYSEDMLDDVISLYKPQFFNNGH